MFAAPTRNAACGRFFEGLGDGRTPGQFCHSQQDPRFHRNVLLDKGRTRRNKGSRRRPTLYTRIYAERSDREDMELKLLVPCFRVGASRERHEGR